MRDLPDPALGPADAAELCLEVYPDRQEALGIAYRLRTAGWIVSMLDAPRHDGTRVVAVVYHPLTYESPGEVICRERDQ